MWTAILLAEAMIASGEADRALVVSGEAITGVLRTAQQEIVDYLDPQMSSLTVGDGAIALTLEAGADGAAGFDFLDLYTLGAFADAISRADMIILLGKALDFTLKFGEPPAIDASARWIVLDPDATLVDRAIR